MMQIASLRYFVEVAKAKSFTRAAQNICISQQGLSRAIQSLENTLSTTLFNRSGKTISLSDAGKELLPFAESICHDYTSMIKTATHFKNDVAQNRDQQLELYATTYFVVAVWKLLEKELGQSVTEDIFVIEKTTYDFIRRLLTDPSGLLGIITIVPDELACLLTNPSLIFEPFFSIDFVVSGSRKLLSPKKRRFTREEVAGLPLGYYNDEQLNRVVDRELSLLQTHKNIKHYSNSNILNSLVADGEAVVLADTFSAYLNRHQIDLVNIPIKDLNPTNIGFLYSCEGNLNPALIEYKESFREMLNTHFSAYISKHPPKPVKPRFNANI